MTLLLLAGCARQHAAIERVRDDSPVGQYHLQGVTGVRDGDQLQAKAVFSDKDSVLTLDMHFKIGVPTKLATGSYQWKQSNRTIEGAVTSNSVTFLGGQNGPPSIGGVFELRGADGQPVYKVRIPTTEVRRQ